MVWRCAWTYRSVEKVGGGGSAEFTVFTVFFDIALTRVEIQELLSPRHFESVFLETIPKYVTQSSDAMFPVRLYEGENFWLRLTADSAQCLRLSERFFISMDFVNIAISPSYRRTGNMASEL